MWNINYDTNEFIYETEKDTHIENRLVVARGRDRFGSLGFTDANCYVYNKQTTNSYCVAQDTIFNIL